MARRQGQGDKAMPAPAPCVAPPSRAPAAMCPAPSGAHAALLDPTTWTTWLAPPGATPASHAPATVFPAPPGAPPCPAPPGAPPPPPDPATWWFDPASAPAAAPHPAMWRYVHRPSSSRDGCHQLYCCSIVNEKGLILPVFVLGFFYV
jgi:hypothetical protein